MTHHPATRRSRLFHNHNSSHSYAGFPVSVLPPRDGRLDPHVGPVARPLFSARQPPSVWPV